MGGVCDKKDLIFQPRRTTLRRILTPTPLLSTSITPRRTMHYKTITLELLQQFPILHEQLRQSGAMLEALHRYATELKASHQAWMEQLKANRPASDRSQLASEALELAVQELQNHLALLSAPDEEMAEPLTLDGAMAFIRRHTPPE
jgi:hypothetical protein